MLSLKQPLEKNINFNDCDYAINLSFDNVLRYYEMLDDEIYDDSEKIEQAFDMFVIEEVKTITFEDKLKIVKQITSFIAHHDNDNQSESEHVTSNKAVYDYEEDAGYIYASFLYDYNLDLIEQQGKLHWDKFYALFNSLSSSSKMQEVIKIRLMEIPTDASPEVINNIAQLKQMYMLKRNMQEIDEEQDRLFDSFFDGEEVE